MKRRRCADAPELFNEVLMKGSPRAYPRSSAICRRYGVQVPERLPPDAWAEWAATRATEEAQYDALDRARLTKLRAAVARGRATRAAHALARRQLVAEAFAKDPHLNRTALARTLGVDRSLIYKDMSMLKLVRPDITCPCCGRPL
jgi:hypothetical protein